MINGRSVGAGKPSSAIVVILLAAVCATSTARSSEYSATEYSAKEYSAITGEVLRAHVEALGAPAMLGRDTPGPGGDLAAQYVAQEFAAAGLEPVVPTSPEPYLHPFSVNELMVYNVVGVLQGGDPEAGAVVVGAHYDGVGARGDSLMPLSDDNASGTAILLAVAAALAGSAATQGPLPHAVVFVAFGSEEDGLLGARHYCEEPPIPLASTRAMINLDTVGRPRSGRLEIVGWSRYRELSALLERAAGEEGVEAVAGPSSLWRRSDQAVFAEAGVPAVWLLGHLRDDIHSRRDTPDGLDYEWMAQVARALVAAIEAGFADTVTD